MYAVAVPSTPLLAHALPYVDWSDAYTVMVPSGPARHPQEWADAVFHSPPFWIRVLFGVREVVVPMLGIERGGGDRRGLVYSAVVRRIHPFVVRGMLARAARTMAALA